MQIRSIYTKSVAAVLACSALYAANYYPISAIWLAIFLGGYAVILWVRPILWLCAVPALLPLLDFAPWTGWFFLEEIDLFLLVTAAVTYSRIGAQDRSAKLPPTFAWLLGLASCAYVVSTVIGLLPITPLDANAFSSYMSHYNSLRIAKGFFWVLIFIPILLRSAGEDLTNVQRYFVPGVLIGLAGVSLAVFWERLVFPGLMNFSADYRTTAPFSAMHTGGAALDGYLALALPFVSVWLVRWKGWSKLTISMALFAFGSYASLTTFSRGVYLAYASAAVIFLTQISAQSFKRGTIKKGQVVVNLALLAVVSFALAHVFTSSGYRGLGASLVVLAAAICIGGIPSRPVRWSHWLLAMLCAAALVLISILFSSGLTASYRGIAKGPYLLFTVSAILFAAGLYQYQFAATERKMTGMFIALVAFPWMAVNAVLLARHWGGNPALGGIGTLVAIAVALIVANRLASQRLWHLGKPTFISIFFIGVVFAAVIPTAGSYYMTERFSTARGDFAYRIGHWTEALAMMDKNLETSVFGMGLGKFPETYFWKNTHGELPSTLRYEREGNNTFLRMGTPKYEKGYGEVLRMLQRVSLSHDQPYTLSLDVRRQFENSTLHTAICERLLLYPQNCIEPSIHLAAPDDRWHHYDIALNSGRLGSHAWLVQAPIQIQIATDGTASYLDIDNVSLLNTQTGEQLIRNGDFSSGNDFWFFSSDRHHLPWHVKNFELNLFFELGWFGLIAVSLLIVYAIVQLIKNDMQREIPAGVYLSSLIGFLLVGLFDSLLDVPRLAILFFLILIVAMLQPVSKFPTDLR